MVGDEPLTIALGLLAHGQGHFKDTATNILETGEFVVNLVDEDHGEAMNITCLDAPSKIQEKAGANLFLAQSRWVKPPRIARLRPTLEGRSFQGVRPGLGQRTEGAHIETPSPKTKQIYS